MSTKSEDSFLVTLKAAISLDAKIACANGDSKWITGKAARHEAHRLRYQHDAILVGIRTVLNDDPRLTVRGVSGVCSPIRIILDSMGRLPKNSKVLTEDGIRVFHVVGSGASTVLQEERENLIRLKAPTKRPEISWVIDRLKKLGIGSLLVEGGSEVHASFIRNRCVTRLHLFIAPKLIGGSEAISWCGDLSVHSLADSSHWKILSIHPVGSDWHLIAEPIER